MIDIDQEAWRLILNCAESSVEDAIDEDGEYGEETFEEIWQRAMSIIAALRVEHAVEVLVD